MKEDKTRTHSFEEFKRKMQDIEKKAKAKTEERMKTKGVKTKFSSVEEMQKYYQCRDFEDFVNDVHKKYGI